MADSGLALIPALGPWLVSADANPAARALYRRHYSSRRYRDGRRPAKFVGPGSYLVLLTPEEDALFVWRRFISQDLVHGQGVNCAVFRNEGCRRSSDLIRAAVEWAWQKWPGQRLYTYVNPRRIRSTNPGWCFVCAGWRKCGSTQGGLVVLELTTEN